MVLLDASSEPEIPVYDRLHAGEWVDGTVQPAPNQTIDIHATVDELRHAPSLGAMPLVVVTAGVLEDRWLATVPMLEARAQDRIAVVRLDPGARPWKGTLPAHERSQDRRGRDACRRPRGSVGRGAASVQRDPRHRPDRGVPGAWRARASGGPPERLSAARPPPVEP
jgi:hypothetical protein